SAWCADANHSAPKTESDAPTVARIASSTRDELAIRNRFEPGGDGGVLISEHPDAEKLCAPTHANFRCVEKIFPWPIARAEARRRLRPARATPRIRTGAAHLVPRKRARPAVARIALALSDGRDRIHAAADAREDGAALLR